MRTFDQELTGWGRSSVVAATCYRPSDVDELATAELPDAELIARGLGRSYGDAAQVRDGAAVVTTECTGVAWADRDAGVVRVAAGTTIGELIDRFVPKGWFVPVSPGTRHVTIGGAIAADVHGKNHHLDGSIGSHVASMRMRLADDSIVDTSPTVRPELFWATVGGMGLTGIVIDAELRLHPIPSSTVRVETVRLGDLNELVEHMRRSDAEHRFSVAWVDLLGGGRSVLTQGSFAPSDQLEPDAAGAHSRPRSPSVGLPPLPKVRFVLSPFVRAFNELWWRRAPAEPTVTEQSIGAFFHPLDTLGGWNRLYGERGFLQWQCVVPDDAVDALATICHEFRTLPAFFTVLKRFGPGNAAPLSFPIAGWTLAVDLPVTAEVNVRLRELDRLVDDAGGRLYLAKDARLDRARFERMYPRLDEWKAVRAAVDPGRRFTSDLAQRLGL